MSSKNKSTSIGGLELMNLGLTQHWTERFSKDVAFSNDGLELLDNGRSVEYWISRKRISNPTQVLGWIIHLTQKGWITTNHIMALICAAHEFGCAVDMHA